jgi:hypothetical protein
MAKMPTNEIEVVYGVTVDVGEHQFLRVSVGRKRDLREGETEADAYRSLWKEAIGEVEKITKIGRKRVAKL